jgi:predicted nuclease of predicted toxin-antitoxin system
MKFLIDQFLSPVLANEFIQAGYDAVHVRDRGMAAASDSDIFDLAEQEDRVILSAETDFGTLLTLRGVGKPSVILLRQLSHIPMIQAALLVVNLPKIENDLIKGSIIIFDKGRIRVRILPLRATCSSSDPPVRAGGLRGRRPVGAVSTAGSPNRPLAPSARPIAVQVALMPPNLKNHTR